MRLDKPVPHSIVLDDVVCRHNITVPSYGGQTKYVIIFTDEKVNKDYVWITASGDRNFIPKYRYSISGRYDEETNRLSYVKIINSPFISPVTGEVISEQPDHESGYKMIIKQRPDALDVLLGEADYSTQVIEQ